MDSQINKPKSPFRWLLAIPIQVFINILMVPLGIWVDTSFWAAASRAQIEQQGFVEGHGIPIFTAIITLVGFGVTIYVTVAAIIGTVVSVVRTRRKQQMDEQQRKPKSPFRWLLVIPIQLGIDVLLVLLGIAADILLGSAGDGIPLITVWAILTGFVVTFFVIFAAVICMVVSRIRSEKNKTVSLFHMKE